jgi:hypothetical protein
MKMIVKSTFFEAEVVGDTIQEVWEQAAFLHALPTKCHVDQSPTRFGFAADQDGNKYYYLESTPQDDRTPVYQFHYGTRREDKKLFPGKVDEVTKKAIQRWVYWDSERQTQVVVWENGRLLTWQQRTQQPVHLPVAMETVQTVTNRTAPVETPPVTRTTAMNITSERCPECNAPAGKLHANKCSLRTIPA